MKVSNCKNLNHSRLRVPVRYCPDCGKALNVSLLANNCGSMTHAQRRKERSHFCVDCGVSLK